MVAERLAQLWVPRVCMCRDGGTWERERASVIVVESLPGAWTRSRTQQGKVKLQRGRNQERGRGGCWSAERKSSGQVERHTDARKEGGRE